jgi:hypothetical protein
MTDNDIDEALRALVEDTPEMSAPAFTAGRARLLAAIGTQPMATVSTTASDPVVLTLPPSPHRRSPPLRRAAPWLVVAAAVAAVTIGTFTLLPGNSAPSGSSPGATQSPTTVNSGAPQGDSPMRLPAMPLKPLNSAGELAAKAANFPVPPGKVLYERSDRTQADDGTELDELWIPADRDAEWLSRRTAHGNIQGRMPQDLSEERAKGGRFGGIEPTDRWAVTAGNVAALPRDPMALYGLLQVEDAYHPLPSNRVAHKQTAVERAAHDLVSMLGDNTGGVPADLRAALLRTLGYLSGVTVTRDASARDGRPAVIIAWGDPDAEVRNELLLDPATARTVEWRNIAQHDFQGYRTGQTVSSDLRTEAVVDALGQRP